VLLFVKHEVYRCDCLQFLVQFYSQVLFCGSFNFNFSGQYVLLGLTSCYTSNIVHYYYTAILCHKQILIARLIVIKIFNRSAALVTRLIYLHKLRM